MLLTDYTLKDFIKILSSKEPVPGGGSASALAGAMGASLTVMVANLTAGKEKFKDSEPLMQELIHEVGSLQMELIELIDLDTEAFKKVREVFRMPKDTETEKKARHDAMQSALKSAAVPPLAIMRKSLLALRLIDKALGKTNPSADSDIGVSALCLKTAMQGGWLNVKINLMGIEDKEYISMYVKEGETILSEGLPLADKISQRVLKSLN